MRDERWWDADSPPTDSRTVMLRFDNDGSRDNRGFYWRAEGSWYKSNESKAKRNAVHPVAWRDLEQHERTAS